MITIDNLTISYKKHSPVIHNLGLCMESSHVHGIVGLNGAGKTTLLNAMYGLVKPQKGNVRFKGQSLNKKNTAYLVTENYFYANITGKEYLSLFNNKAFDIEHWNQLFQLPLQQVIDGYSTGMKKKLALLGVLKQDKPVMILDEPYNGLDMETSRIVQMILLKLKEKGKTIIVTSHIIETLTQLCDYIHYLENGRISYSRDKHGFETFERNVINEIEHRNEQLVEALLA